MQVIDNLAFAQAAEPAAVTVGSYDGVHIGHQQLLGQMMQSAGQHGYSTAVITFHPRPQAVLAPHRLSLDLITPDEKIRLFCQLGVDLVATLPFTPELARVSAAEFVQDLVARLHMRQLWVGAGFTLGRGREGDVPFLARLGQATGFEVRLVDPVMCDGEPVSSTRIRHALAQGDIRQVTRLLGRYHALTGSIVHGALRGRQLGFPTANLAPPAHLVVPPNGVYACFACVGDLHRPAVANVGIRPTFIGQEEHTIEAHLLDFDGDLYGQTARLELVEFLRPERRFDGPAALVRQIRVDIEEARHILKGEATAPGCAEIPLTGARQRQPCDQLPGPAGPQ
jgi:riboflavin kinase/FMN adenylyltransferase